MAGAGDHNEIAFGCFENGVELDSGAHGDEFVLIAMNEEAGEPDGTELGLVGFDESEAIAVLDIEAGARGEPADVTGAAFEDEALEAGGVICSNFEGRVGPEAAAHDEA